MWHTISVSFQTKVNFVNNGQQISHGLRNRFYFNNLSIHKNKIANLILKNRPPCMPSWVLDGNRKMGQELTRMGEKRLRLCQLLIIFLLIITDSILIVFLYTPSQKWVLHRSTFTVVHFGSYYYWLLTIQLRSATVKPGSHQASDWLMCGGANDRVDKISASSRIWVAALAAAATM